MTISPDDATAISNALFEAARTRVPLAPITATFPDLDVADAYTVQRHQVARWKAHGRSIVGYKVGLTSAAMQQQLGVDQPDFGHLFDDMILDAAAPIGLEPFISPRIEPEFSFVLASELRGPGLTEADALAAIDYALISLEIIDSRIADWRIALSDTIADNASSGAVVLGPEQIDVSKIDLATAGVRLSRNGEQVSQGAGAAVLGHPIRGLLWVSNTLGSLGQPLEAGSIVMSGSITPAVALAPGDEISADFGELGTLAVSFV